MSGFRSRGFLLMVVLLVAACTPADDGPPQVRGPKLPVASLSINESAAIQAAAIGAAFNPDPGLSLLVDPVYLPRTAGRAGGASVAPALIARLKQQGVVRGTCQTPRDAARTVPVCPAALPGYVIRFSEIFGLGGDSVQVHLAATRYRRVPKEPAEVLTFERVYQVVRVRGSWQVMREARIPRTD